MSNTFWTGGIILAGIVGSSLGIFTILAIIELRRHRAFQGRATVVHCAVVNRRQPS